LAKGAFGNANGAATRDRLQQVAPHRLEAILPPGFFTARNPAIGSEIQTFPDVQPPAKSPVMERSINMLVFYAFFEITFKSIRVFSAHLTKG
jgi:hypothetical protein